MRTICFFNTTIPWGGGEKWHLDAALSFARRGWRVLVICHPKSALHGRILALSAGSASAPPLSGSLEAVPLAAGRLTFLNPLMRAHLRRFFRQRRVHAVILNLSSDLKLAAQAARDTGVPHVIYRRGSALPVRDTALNRRLFGRAITRLIVNSEATKRLVAPGLLRLMPRDAVTVLSNGIDVAAFDGEREAAARAANYDALFPGTGAEAFFAPRAPGSGPGSGPLVLGNAGRLNRQKGQHMLLLLGRKLLDRGLDFRLVIAGAGERLEELKQLAGELGLENRVLFTGFMDNMAPFWTAVDVFVLTSLWEGFGFVLLEAMLAQKPVLAFEVSNIPELITSGVNGRLFPLPLEERANSPEPGPETAGPESAVPYASLDAMAEAVAHMAANPRSITAMGEAGRTFAENRFSQEKKMDELERLLE